MLYTGTGSSNAITGVGFQPDFAWIKDRTNAYQHQAFDAVRGVTKKLHQSTTAAEATDTTSLTAFGADGFTVSTNAGLNTNTASYVAWNWKANGSGSSNTNGSINTTKTSANVDAGFSMITYTGTGSAATIGHGLSVAPEFVIVKRRDATDDWMTYYGDNTDYVIINGTQATADANTVWNDTSPTASVFSIGTAGGVNASSGTYIAYCFHSVDGYSKVGSYTGNGVADGPFVYTGFRPAFVLTKVTNAADDWSIADYARSPHNVAGESLRPNSNAAEDSAADIDILSNGFKVRQADSHRINYSGDTFIYIALAESPFKYSNAK